MLERFFFSRPALHCERQANSFTRRPGRNAGKATFTTDARRASSAYRSYRSQWWFLGACELLRVLCPPVSPVLSCRLGRKTFCECRPAWARPSRRLYKRWYVLSSATLEERVGGDDGRNVVRLGQPTTPTTCPLALPPCLGLGLALPCLALP